MKRFCAAALLTLALCPGAEAEMLTGIDLYKNCTAESGSVERFSCLGFIEGAINMALVVQKISPDTLPAVCMPAGYPGPVDGFIAWAGRHPQELGRPAGEAFAASWFDPVYCKNKSGVGILR